MLPTFTTERLLLRPRTLDDLDDCLAMDRDPQVTRHIAGPWSDPAAHRAFVLARMSADYPEGHGYWTIIARDRPAEFVGWMLLLPYRAVGDEVEIGWRLVRAHWGKGYATEAAAAILDHAFDSVGLEEVVADIDPRNLASIRVAEKLGMRHAGDRVIGGESARSYRKRADG